PGYQRQANLVAQTGVFVQPQFGNRRPLPTRRATARLRDAREQISLIWVRVDCHPASLPAMILMRH
ncbi:hypothetical protein RSW38_24015, partial [Escherichia coli]|nr:hypothetical protein [Escherichia coli]